MSRWGLRWTWVQIFFTVLACTMLVVEFYIGQTTWLFYLEVRRGSGVVDIDVIVSAPPLRSSILLRLFSTMSCILLRRATRSGEEAEMAQAL